MRSGEANRVDKVTKQLGLAPGIARYRLVKLILFRFARHLGMDLCFRCGERIESADELSIEHKEPWLDVDSKLYWDENNIAFSHLRCNKPHRFHGGIYCRKLSPKGKSWCSSCKKHLPVKRFYVKPKGGRWNGLSPHCKKCQREHSLKYKNKRKAGREADDAGLLNQ
jgi:hypothetical protein